MTDSEPPALQRKAIFVEGQDGLLSNRVLQPKEYWWRDHQKWLEQKGYMLRPRFREGWTPSWGDGEDKYFLHEDSVFIGRSHILDATRISDGEMVMLKRTDKTIHPYELEITQYFSTEPIASHPHNHCVPLYEVLELPEEPNSVILVVPLLSESNYPKMVTVGEAVEFFRQIIEGLQFIHQSRVAHRDCMYSNIMMDPKGIFPDMFHPAVPIRTPDYKKDVRYRSRTAVPVKYYFIDFGISRKYDSSGDPPLEPPIMGGDRTVPEFQGEGIYEPINPFPTDIYYLGNMIRLRFFKVTRSLDFMEPLVADMTQDDPTKRPSIDEVVERFNGIQRSLSQWNLRSRIRYTDEEKYLLSAYLNVKHFFRTLTHVLLFRSATPTPQV